MALTADNGLLRAFLLTTIIMGHMTQKTEAQIANLDTLCQNYPRNSRCEDYVAANPDSLNESDAHLQVIRVDLETTGPDNELVLIEINEKIADDITLSAYHVEKTEGLLYTALNGAVGAVAPIPIPFDLFEVYDLESSPTEYIAFTPDSCQVQPSLASSQGFSDCSIMGTNTLSLSEEIDIRSGAFTLGYTEGDLFRAVTFRISDHDAAFVDELDIDNLCQTYPLNSQCRYWPISQTE